MRRALLLNYPGKLGGPKKFPDRDLQCGSRSTCEIPGEAQIPSYVCLTLIIPPIFTPTGKSRRGSCFYAGKYKDFHGGDLLPVTRDSVEILVGPTLLRKLSQK